MSECQRTSNHQVYILRCLHERVVRGEQALIGSALKDAADEIERLRAENAALLHDLERAMANHVADINADESAPIPPTQTRRDAFLAWWKSVWAPDDPRSSPGFDAAMEQWSWDAWRAGGDYERQRLSVETDDWCHEHGYREHKRGSPACERAAQKASEPIDLNLEPIGKCNKCGRKVWKPDTLGKLDEMTQPDGSQCGGRFIAL